MKKMNSKENKGITLIALIITIIVLLILAGVTITALTGEKGVIKEANDAKSSAEQESAVEKAQAAALAATKKDGTIDKTILNNKLGTNITSFPATVTIEGAQVTIYENGDVSEPVDYATLESKYGTVVSGYSGYSATDVTEWKLFYVDESNKDAFLISSNVLAAPQPTSNGIPLTSVSGVSYTGSSNVASSEYGRNYNGLWLAKCGTGTTTVNTKPTAYLCDANNWKQYVTGKAKYAAGGPTLELLVASIKNKQVKNINSEITDEIITVGYPNTLDIEWTSNGVYNTGNSYWIASPSKSRGTFIHYMHGEGNIQSANYYNTSMGLRPVVCLPATAIQINDNGTLQYKQ